MPQHPPDPPDSKAESHRWKREPRRELQKGSGPEDSEREEYKKSLRVRPGHPETELLEGLMRNELSAAERRGVIRHLLTGCPRCVEVTRRYWFFGSPWSSAADDPSPADTADRTEGELLCLPQPGRTPGGQPR